MAVARQRLEGPPFVAREREPIRSTASGLLVPVVLTVAILGLAAAMRVTNYDIWGGFWVAPVLLVFTMPLAVHAGRAEGDPKVAPTIMVAALVKLVAGTALRYWQIWVLYHGSADAVGYDAQGRLLAPAFRHFDFGNLGEISGTRSIEIVSGGVYALVGNTTLGGFMVFSWLAFVGLWCFYRAFVVAYPNGDKARYRLLVFFFPTLLFWPSSLGKEALMIFCLGVATLGIAHVYAGRLWALVPAGLGLWGSAVIRPHVTLIVLVGMGAGMLFGFARRRTERRGPRQTWVGVLAALALVVALPALAGRTADYLNVDKLSATSASDVLANVSQRTDDETGSSFAPTNVTSPDTLLTATITVIFRPFPGEVPGVPGVIAGLEGLSLLVLVLLSVRRLLRIPSALRDSALVSMAIVVTMGFVYGFAAVGNFGLLARERSQVLPFVFVLLAIPIATRTSDPRPNQKPVVDE